MVAGEEKEGGGGDARGEVSGGAGGRLGLGIRRRGGRGRRVLLSGKGQINNPVTLWATSEGKPAEVTGSCSRTPPRLPHVVNGFRLRQKRLKKAIRLGRLATFLSKEPNLKPSQTNPIYASNAVQLDPANGTCLFALQAGLAFSVFYSSLLFGLKLCSLS